jgi:hypothetical protein
MLDLDDLLNDGKKIFVKNTSRPMGHIILTFVTANGKAVPRNIPRTWIPICLTDTLSPDIIRQSNELRQFISKGILALVDPVKALEEMQEPDAIEEEKRLHLSDFSNKAVATERVIALDNQYTAEQNPLNPQGPPEGMTVDPVNNRVKSTLLRVEAKDITEREAVSEFRIMEDEMTSHDLTYVISQMEKDGKEGPLRKWAFRVLAASQGTPAVEEVVGATEEADVEEPDEDPAAALAGRAHQVIT